MLYQFKCRVCVGSLKITIQPKGTRAYFRHSPGPLREPFSDIHFRNVHNGFIADSLSTLNEALNFLIVFCYLGHIVLESVEMGSDYIPGCCLRYCVHLENSCISFFGCHTTHYRLNTETTGEVKENSISTKGIEACSLTTGPHRLSHVCVSLNTTKDSHGTCLSPDNIYPLDPPMHNFSMHKINYIHKKDSYTHS